MDLHYPNNVMTTNLESGISSYLVSEHLICLTDVNLFFFARWIYTISPLAIEIMTNLESGNLRFLLSTLSIAYLEVSPITWRVKSLSLPILGLC